MCTSDKHAPSEPRGVFISLEGVDGSGKSTQLQLLSQALEKRGVEHICLREPGGTAISERIRALVLDPANKEMVSECELLLYEASRAQLVREIIEPALNRGCVVLCDRYFDSTTAYQAYGRGLELSLVEAANALGSCSVMPQLTIVLDIDATHALSRATRTKTDRMEAGGTEFMCRVAAGYHALVATGDSRFCMLDGHQPEETLHEQVYALVEPLLIKHGLMEEEC